VDTAAIVPANVQDEKKYQRQHAHPHEPLAL
jgi:hypothetical protein